REAAMTLVGKKAATSLTVGIVSTARMRCTGWISVKDRATNFSRPTGLLRLGPIASRMSFSARWRATGSSNRNTVSAPALPKLALAATTFNSTNLKTLVLAGWRFQTTESLPLSSLLNELAPVSAMTTNGGLVAFGIGEPLTNHSFIFGAVKKFCSSGTGGGT